MDRLSEAVPSLRGARTPGRLGNDSVSSVFSAPGSTTPTTASKPRGAAPTAAMHTPRGTADARRFGSGSAVSQPDHPARHKKNAAKEAGTQTKGDLVPTGQRRQPDRRQLQQPGLPSRTSHQDSQATDGPEAGDRGPGDMRPGDPGRRPCGTACCAAASARAASGHPQHEAGALRRTPGPAPLPDDFKTTDNEDRLPLLV